MSHIKWIKLDTGHSIGSTVSTWQLSFYFWQRWPKFKPKFTSKKFRLFTILMLLIFHWWVTEECGKVVKLCTVLNIVFCLYACNHSVPYWEWLATARLSPFSLTNKRGLTVWLTSLAFSPISKVSLLKLLPFSAVGGSAITIRISWQ